MLNLLKQKNKRTEEEEKKQPEGSDATFQPLTKKKSPGEIRLKKEIAELDLPNHVETNFTDNIMKFEICVDLKNEECLWKGGKYRFTITVSSNYPHEAPKCHCDTQIYHPNIDL